MSNELVKDFTVGTPGDPPTPGSPGSPGRPGYCLVVKIDRWMSFVEQFGYGIITHLPPVPVGEDASIGSGHGWLETHGGTVHWRKMVCTGATPPTPGSSGSPGTSGTPPNYNIGWNSGADSVGALSGTGAYGFNVLHGVGVVTGLTNVSLGVSYAEIKHGFYFTAGNVRVMESGSQVTSHRPYTDVDRFTIYRSKYRVRYFQNDTLLRDTESRIRGSAVADASLYFGGDSIFEAQLDDGEDPDFASHDGGSFYGGIDGGGGFGAAGSNGPGEQGGYGAGSGGSGFGTGGGVGEAGLPNQGGNVDPVTGKPRPPHGFTPANGGSNESGSTGEESLGMGPHVGRPGLDNIGMFAICVPAAEDVTGESWANISVDDIGMLASGDGTGIPEAPIHSYVNIDIEPITMQAVSLDPNTSVAQFSVDDIGLYAEQGLLRPNYSAASFSIDDLFMFALTTTGIRSEVNINIGGLGLFAVSGNPDGVDNTHVSAFNADIGDIEMFAMDGFAGAPRTAIFAQVSGAFAEPLLFVYGVTDPDVRIGINLVPSGPLLVVESGGEVKAEPSGPSLSVTGTTTALARIAAEPDGLAAAIVGQTANVGRIAAKPDGLSAAIVGQTPVIAHIAAWVQSPQIKIVTAGEIRANVGKPSLSVAGTTAALARIRATPSGPSLAVSSYSPMVATIRAVKISGPSVSIVGAGYISATTSKPSLAVTGKTGCAASIAATPSASEVAITSITGNVGYIAATPSPPAFANGGYIQVKRHARIELMVT